MKANEAPEKLFLDATSKCGDTVFIIKNNDTDIEYIRIDAFIERAEEYIYKQLNEGSIECGNIENFIKDFKNYMKGGLL